jgi:hypothetical protein
MTATILNFEAALLARDPAHRASEIAARACASLRACIADDPGMADASAAAAAIGACDDLGDHFTQPHAAVLTPAEARAAGALVRDYLAHNATHGEAAAALVTIWDRLSA